MSTCKGRSFPEPTKRQMSRAIRRVRLGKSSGERAVIGVNLKLKEMKEVPETAPIEVELKPEEKGVYTTRAYMSSGTFDPKKLSRGGLSPHPNFTDIKFLLENHDKDPCICLGGWVFKPDAWRNEKEEWVGCYSKDSFIRGQFAWNAMRFLYVRNYKAMDDLLKKLQDKYGTNDARVLKSKLKKEDWQMLEDVKRLQDEFTRKVDEEVLPYMEASSSDNTEFKV